MYPPFDRTGRTRRYTIVISKKQDTRTRGNSRKYLVCTNGTTPGPTLRAQLGDTVSVTVINDIFDDSTSVHWHGFTLTDTPWADGSIDVSQCPISNVPGRNEMEYTFTPQSAGTYWYHSHHRSQYPDGK